MSSLGVEDCHFDQTPNIKTLKSLVHASPSYHQIHRIRRNELLTAVTLREMSKRGMDLSGSVAFAHITLSRQAFYALDAPKIAFSSALIGPDRHQIFYTLRDALRKVNELSIRPVP